MWQEPPNFFLTAASHIRWFEVAVFGGVPFCSQFRSFCGQVVVSDPNISSRYLISSSTDCERFVILSNDRGFDCVCSFWSRQGRRVERHPLRTQALLPEINPAVKASTQPNIPNNAIPDDAAEKKAIRKSCLKVIKTCFPRMKRCIPARS